MADENHSDTYFFEEAFKNSLKLFTFPQHGNVLTEEDTKIKKMLSDIDLSHLNVIFVKQDISFDMLWDLDDTDLEKIGIEKLGNRRKILQAIATLDNQSKLISLFIFSWWHG